MSTEPKQPGHLPKQPRWTASNNKTAKTAKAKPTLEQLARYKAFARLIFSDKPLDKLLNLDNLSAADLKASLNKLGALDTAETTAKTSDDANNAPKL